MKSIGGNSGYIGFSESKRSFAAKEDGKYPKSIFKIEYGISEKMFQTLIERNIIEVSEWHHTSKFGNKTEFFKINDDILFYFMIGNIEKSFSLYKNTKNYEKPILYNSKKNIYSNSIILKRGSAEASILLDLGLDYYKTKRGNYEFRLNKILLKNNNVRSIFNLNYKSENIL